MARSKRLVVDSKCAIDFGLGPKRSSVLTWGDLYTAYWQTRIPNITVYMPLRGSQLGVYLFPLIKLLMSIPFVQKRAMEKAGKIVGPSAEDRAKNSTCVWGEAKNATGKTLAATIKVPNGYTVTMDGILITADFLSSYQGDGGCFTPSQLMGAELSSCQVLASLPFANKRCLISICHF